MSWYGWYQEPGESLEYREPRPEDYVTNPQESASASTHSPEDYSASNDDFDAFIREVKAKMTDTDDAIVEWNNAKEGFTSAVSRRRPE